MGVSDRRRACRADCDRRRGVVLQRPVGVWAVCLPALRVAARAAARVAGAKVPGPAAAEAAAPAGGHAKEAVLADGRAAEEEGEAHGPVGVDAPSAAAASTRAVGDSIDPSSCQSRMP